MFKRILNTFRYSYFGSRVINFIFYPLYRLAINVANGLQKKLKFNGISITYNGISIRFPRDVGMGILSNIKLRGENGFEPYTSKVLLSLGKNVDVFLDIGSNFGIYSVLLKKGNSNLIVFSFEPILELAEANRLFHKQNGLEPNVFNIALTDRRGEIEIVVPQLNSPQEVHTATLEEHFAFNNKFNIKKRLIKVDSLDHFSLTEFNQLQSFKYLLKIDVEGHEVGVLNGAILFIKKNLPFIVCEVDHHGERKIQLGELLFELNYTPYAITGVGLIKLTPDEFVASRLAADYLFSPIVFLDGKQVFSYEELVV